jgi:ferredoxin
MSDTYRVEIQHDGQVHVLDVPADRAILAAAADAGLILPSSCNAGVCTTCAARVVEGTIDPGDSMGLSPDLRAQGFALLCTSFPRSDLKIQTGCEDEVYELQFGQFQK